MHVRALLVLLLVCGLLASPLNTEAIVEDLEIYDFHFSPRLNMTYVQLEPGEHLEREMYISNVYSFPMDNVTLEMEIYRYRTDEVSADPSDVSSPPSISTGGGPLVVDLGTMEPGTNGTFSHPVKTTKDTAEGVWFIRTRLEFDVNGSHYLMLSRGHFDDDLWKESIANNSVFKTIEGENISTGGFDLDLLGIDGIIPDTSITVKTPLGLIPFFILAAVTGFFGIMALVFYLQEEKNMFPKAEWTYQRMKGKILVLRTMLEDKLKKN